MKTNIHFRSHLAKLFLERKIFQKNVVQKLETHILCSMPFFFENRPIYEIMWKNFIQRGRSQMIIWRKSVACWVPTATNAHTVFVILIAFQLQKWLHERASMLRYRYTICIVSLTNGLHALVVYFQWLVRQR